jgi:polysaccharide biosynthesis/export protein
MLGDAGGTEENVVNSKFAIAWPASLLVSVLFAAAVATLPASARADVTATDASPPAQQATEYRIGPLDTLSITVFEVKDLSFDKVQVDASGQLVLPLIGVVTAQGKTARDLSDELARRLDATYMRDPQVSVVVVESQSQKITVEGAVMDSGVFQLRGSSSLLQAIALAKGASKTADLGHVTIFRTVGGERQKMVYNGKAIEAGKEGDPVVIAGDLIVVGESGTKNAMQHIVDLAPALYILSALHP